MDVASWWPPYAACRKYECFADATSSFTQAQAAPHVLLRLQPTGLLTHSAGAFHEQWSRPGGRGHVSWALSTAAVQRQGRLYPSCAVALLPVCHLVPQGHLLLLAHAMLPRRLLPQPENEAPTTEEPEEEEGEVAHHDSNAAAAAHGPWVRKVLRQALQQHPVTTLTFCFGCLGTSGRNSSSSSAVVPALVQGVRLWLRDHILREASPSREGTPMDCDGAAAAAAGCASAAAAAGGGVGNGMQAPKAAAVVAAAAAAGGGAAGVHHRGCALQAVLESSAELRAWVRKESKGISRGEVAAHT